VVAQALDAAARRWPNEPRSKLLLRLVSAGGAALEQGDHETKQSRRRAIEATSGKYANVFDATYLDDLRHDWPE
jgi:hypothetical protein